MKYLLLICLLTTSSFCFSQFNFKKGYIVLEGNGKHIEGYIKKTGNWVNNPNTLVFREFKDDSNTSYGVNQLREFAVYEEEKFVKALVNIDKSSNSTNRISDSREFDFVEEALFLKVLVEGQKSLYKFKNNKIIKYFFKIEDGPIEQLQYKKYTSKKGDSGLGNDFVRENRGYIRQLKSSVACTLDSNDGMPEYREKDLIAYFVKNNNCYDQSLEDITSYEDTNPKGEVNLNLIGGFNFSKLEATISGEGEARNELDYNRKLQLRFGIGVEFISSSRKLSYIVESTYNTKYQADNTGNGPDNTAEYSFIRSLAGMRYHFLLDNKSSIFLSGGFYFDANLNGNILPPPTNSFESFTDVTAGLVIGGGFKYDKLSLELKTSRNSPFRNQFTNGKFGTITVVLSYAIL